MCNRTLNLFTTLRTDPPFALCRVQGAAPTTTVRYRRVTTFFSLQLLMHKTLYNISDDDDYQWRHQGGGPPRVTPTLVTPLVITV